ncbi:hypothetical protein K1719_000876 [Acacia pycnantha]|nr:hypothetical protein K1719_000876 [Acacia pycnantha]
MNFPHPPEGKYYLVDAGYPTPVGYIGPYKLKYVDRVELLWEHVRRKEMKIPVFVPNHDSELEYNPTLHFDVDNDLPLYYASP